MVCNSCFHRRRDAEGLVNAAEIVVHLVESNRMGEGGEGGKGDRREVSVTLKSPIIVSQTSLVKQISENVPPVPEVRDPVRRAPSPRHVWHAIRGLLPLGAPLVAPPLPGAVTHLRSSNKVMGWRENYYNELD